MFVIFEVVCLFLTNVIGGSVHPKGINSSLTHVNAVSDFLVAVGADQILSLGMNGHFGFDDAVNVHP